MRGPDLLLAHLALLGEEPCEERPSARARLEEELGPELATRLVAALAPHPDEER